MSILLLLSFTKTRIKVMISTKSDQKIKLRFVKKYGDADIILGFYTTEFWQRLLKRDPLWAWSLFRDFLRFITAVSAFAVGSLLRYRHGSKTTGIIMSTATTLWLMTLNSALLPYLIKPFCFWGSPILFLLSDYSWQGAMIQQTLSSPLLGFTVLHIAFSLAHIVMIYMGMGHTDSNQRGCSWLGLILSKHTTRISEQDIQMIVEPLLIGLCGYISWSNNDLVFAGFLWSAAFSTFLQEYLDYAWKKKHDSYF